MSITSRTAVTILGLLLICTGLVVAENSPYHYQTPDEINKSLHNFGGQIHTLAQTPGGRDLLLLELGGKDKNSPAIMIIANPDADYPLASEAALAICEKLTSDWKEDLDKYRWYIVPCANPDGYARFFNSPLSMNNGNGRAVNDDMDDAVDEDGPDDLNKDGFITKIRQVHPEGTWIEVEGEPLLLKKAEAAKGEVGKYRLLDEGLDNDGDGEYDEDAPGGVIVGYNFPHEFTPYTPQYGLHAASEAESRGILEFAFAHPDIAMVLVLGRSNSLKDVPESNNKGRAAQDKYELPHWLERRAGLDEGTKMTLAEIVELGKDVFGARDLTEDMVVQFLNLGAAVNPNKDDVAYWEEISKEYNDFIKEAKLDGKRLKPPAFHSGSIEEWAYYQYGVPTFSMDFWTLPEPEKKDAGGDKPEGYISPDSLEKMSSDDFIALGDEKIAAYLKAVEAPPMMTAERITQALQGGMLTTAKMAEMIRDKEKKKEAGGADETDEALLAYNPDAFVPWAKYNHPTLGEVEIGGRKPYATVLPHDSVVAELIDKQIPFIRTLAGKLPSVVVEKVETKKRADGVWQVTAWVDNQGFLPYPTYQGKRCGRPTPALVSLNGPKDLKFLEGRERQSLGLLSGSGGQSKVVWVVAVPDGSKLNVTSEAFSAGTDNHEFTLKEGGR